MLYSCHYREKDEMIVQKLEDFANQLFAKVRFAVDIACTTKTSEIFDQSTSLTRNTTDHRLDSLILLLTEQIPSNGSSFSASWLPSIISLRLLLLKTSQTDFEKALVETLLNSYLSYINACRHPRDIAALLVLDFMFLVAQQPIEQQNLNALSLVP